MFVGSMPMIAHRGSPSGGRVSVCRSLNHRCSPSGGRVSSKDLSTLKNYEFPMSIPIILLCGTTRRSIVESPGVCDCPICKVEGSVFIIHEEDRFCFCFIPCCCTCSTSPAYAICRVCGTRMPAPYAIQLQQHQRLFGRITS